ncbi:MAG: UDP-N-acetylmuramoyl-L-alanine--D-glutamate ligase [Nocardioidaceae bacterium]
MGGESMTGGPDVSWLNAAHRHSAWDQLRVVVVGGLGVSGFAAADALQHLGAHVTVLDDRPDAGGLERATLLEILGVDVRQGEGSTDALPDVADLVIASSGAPPTLPVLVTAMEQGRTVWGDVELAWRLRDPEHHTPWLCLTGTNGKTTTVRMLESILQAEGLLAVAAGNVGLPVCEVVMSPDPLDVVAVELSSYQLHWSSSVSAQAAAVLNLAPDHLSWHGGYASYRAAKSKVYEHCQLACVYNVEDPATRELVEAADVVEGCRAIGFTIGVPSVGMVGLVDDVLADRAFIEGRERNAAELASLSDLSSSAPHNVANALAAAALGRAHGVSVGAVRRGLRSFRLDSHRIQVVRESDGAVFVDDSKATNPHAAAASLLSYESAVWIAGGLAKGAEFDELVLAVKSRLRGVVLMGADRATIGGALARHAPDVPVIEVAGTDTGVMKRVVDAAVSLAVPGDIVLLAPACASQDLFADYSARGDAFAAAVRRVGGH